MWNVLGRQKRNRAPVVKAYTSKPARRRRRPAAGPSRPSAGEGLRRNPGAVLVSMQGKANKAKEKNEERNFKEEGIGTGGRKIWSRWESLEVSRLQLHEQHVPEWAHATKRGSRLWPPSLYLVNVAFPSRRTTCTLCLLGGASRRQVQISCPRASESTCKPRWGPMTKIKCQRAGPGRRGVVNAPRQRIGPSPWGS